MKERNATELAEALCGRATHLCGEWWEAPATAAMMVEAADMIEKLEEREVARQEAAFKAGWAAHIEQQTPCGDSESVDEAFARWRG